MKRAAEDAFPRDPDTGLILGAEPFEFGHGRHAVLFLHGWSSSPRELRFLAQKVAAAGCFCRGILLPGHGRTVADLADTRFEDYLDAAQQGFDALQAEHAQVSVCGLSLGGLLALYLAARRPVANLVLCAPFLVPAGRTFGLPNRWVLRLLPPSDRLIPKTGGGPMFDPEAVRDHVAYSSMPLRGILSVFHAARNAWPFLPGVVNPALIFHAPKDHTSAIAGSRRLLRELGSKDKRLIEVERSRHVITLDYDRDRIERETVDWLAKRM